MLADYLNLPQNQILLQRLLRSMFNPMAMAQMTCHDQFGHRSICADVSWFPQNSAGNVLRADTLEHAMHSQMVLWNMNGCPGELESAVVVRTVGHSDMQILILRRGDHVNSDIIPKL